MHVLAIKQVPRRPPFRAEVYVDGDQVLLRIRHNVLFLTMAGIFTALLIIAVLDQVSATRIVPYGHVVCAVSLLAALSLTRMGFDRQDWRLDLPSKFIVYDGYRWLFSGRGMPVMIERIEIVPISLYRGAHLREWDMHAVVIRGEHNRYWIVAVEEHAPSLMEWVHEWAPADWVSRSNKRMSLRVCV